jgi:hypothetical protein
VTGALPSHADERESYEALGAALARPWGRGAVAWVARPWLLAVAQSDAGKPYHPLEPLSARRLRRELRRSSAASLVDRPLRGLSVDGILFLPGTLNQERVLRPVAERLGEPQAPPRLRGRRRRAAALGREAVESWEALLEEMRRAGAGAPFPSIGVVRTLLASARFLAYAEVAVAALQPRAVVLGSTHNGPERAFAHIARRAGVPTVYLPHAPALTESRINDLPVDYAGLRGPMEVETYVGHGAQADRLEVIGNPALTAREPPAIDESLPPVLAVSPVAEETLSRLIELCHQGLGDEVTLSPHPRSHPKQLRELAPAGWRLSSGLTYDLLREGPPAVIQRSSGVALEALQLGIPAIQLSFPGDRPGYPLIREPWVRMASDASELAAAVAACRASAADHRARSELIDWARRWCWPMGVDAAELGASLVRRAAVEGARPEPIWDAWGTTE